MEKENKERMELYMPSGIKLTKEIFQGFGKKEMKNTIIAALIFMVIDCILFIIGIRKVEVLFFLPVLGVTAVAFMQIKGELNLSPVDVIKLEIEFSNSQKYYPYVAKNEWEDID